MMRKELEDILSREEYRAYYREDSRFISRLFEKILNWIVETLEEIFPEIDVSPFAAEALSYGIVIVFFALFLFFVFHFMSKVVRQSRVKQAPVRSKRELLMSADKHLAEADRWAKKGDWPSALRHVFLALILHLDKEKLIKAGPWKTNQEYVEEIRAHRPQAADAFYELAVRFDETIYGGRSLAAEAYEAYRRTVIEWMRRDERQSSDPLDARTGKEGSA